MSDSSKTYSTGISVFMLLSIVFTVLKLTGYINWSWWWVWSPVLIPIGIALVVALVCLIIGIIQTRKENRR